MTERILRDYFENKISGDILNKDIEGSHIKTGNDTSRVDVMQIESDEEFVVSTSHLLKLCEDCISDIISSNNLNSIAFALICSEYFVWDNITSEGKLVSETIYNWDNPKMNFPLSKDNLLLWKKFLLTGLYELN